jgi:hypothetical protein
VEISVGGAGWSHAAFGRSPEPAGNHRDFMLIQITSTSAKQNSVLIIHACSPFAVGSVERTHALSKELFDRA